MNDEQKKRVAAFEDWWKKAEKEPPYSNPKEIAKSAWVACAAVLEKEWFGDIPSPDDLFNEATMQGDHMDDATCWEWVARRLFMLTAPNAAPNTAATQELRNTTTDPVSGSPTPASAAAPDAAICPICFKLAEDCSYGEGEKPRDCIDKDRFAEDRYEIPRFLRSRDD